MLVEKVAILRDSMLFPNMRHAYVCTVALWWVAKHCWD